MFNSLLSTLSLVIFTLMCLSAQCPEGDIDLSTQAKLYAFGRLYPDCTEINGNLIVSGLYDNYTDIHDLSPLSNITKIHGNLNISNTLGLKEVDMPNLIKVDSSIYLQNNFNLQSLSFLSQLDTVQSLILRELRSITTLAGIENIKHYRGRLSLSELTQLETFPLLSTERINEYLYISRLPNLVNLEWLAGLQHLGSFSLFQNENLENISALANISNDLTSIWITNNFKLSNCNIEPICNSFANELSINIGNNGANCQDEQNVAALCGVSLSPCPEGTIYLRSQSEVDNFASLAQSCDTIQVDLYLYSEDSDPITHLDSLIYIKSIDGSLNISSDELVNLKGLDSLGIITGELSIVANDKLENLDGLQYLQEVGSIYLSQNNTITSLEGLSLDGKSTDSFGLYNNASLEDISAISGMDSIRESLYLRQNDRLSDVSPIFSFNFIKSLSFFRMNALKSIGNNGATLNIEKLLINYSEQLNTIEFDDNFYISDEINIVENVALESITIKNTGSTFSGLNFQSNPLLNEIDLGVHLRELNGYTSIINCDQLETLQWPSVEKIDLLRINSNDALQSISNFSSLDSIAILSISNNKLLSDISGFDRPFVLDSLSITNNSLLSDCQIAPICQMADLSKVEIMSNGSGCNSISSAYSGCPNVLKNPIGDIVINGIEELEYLMQEYPNADSIMGSLTFRNYPDLYLAGLSYFENIDYIKDELYLVDVNILSLEPFANTRFAALNITQVDSLRTLPLFEQIDTLEYLTITSCPSINNISGLSNVSYVRGELHLSYLPLLEDITGLDQIKKIDFLRLRNLNISNLDVFNNLDSLDGMGIYNNTDLSSIQGLSNVQNLTSIYVKDNIQLLELMDPLKQDSIHYVWIDGSNVLDSFNTFDNIKKIGRLFRIASCDALKKLNLPNVESIGENTIIGLTIYDNNSLTDISMPKVKYISKLEIQSNPSLTHGGAFDLLEEVGSIVFFKNVKMHNLDGFNDALIVNNKLEIKENVSLELCNTPFICNHLYYGREANFVENGAGCETEAQVEQACGFIAETCPSTDYLMDSNRSTELYNQYYSNCKVLPGELYLKGSFTTQPKLDNLVAIKNDLTITQFGLDEISFNSLEIIGRDLEIKDSGLSQFYFPKLVTCGNLYSGDVIIEDNDRLSSIETFESLEYLINRGVKIINNSSLTLVSGFDNLYFLSDMTITDNESLLSIDGFNIQNRPNKITISNNAVLNDLPMFDQEIDISNLIITDNPLLENCNQYGICIHVSNDRNSTIANNANGCNDEDEILISCTVATEDLTDSVTPVTVYPNPTEGVIFFNQELHSLINAIEIYNLAGNLVNRYTSNFGLIDLGSYPTQTYILRVIMEDRIENIKIIKE